MESKNTEPGDGGPTAEQEQDSGATAPAPPTEIKQDSQATTPTSDFHPVGRGARKLSPEQRAAKQKRDRARRAAQKKDAAEAQGRLDLKEAAKKAMKKLKLSKSAKTAGKKATKKPAKAAGKKVKKGDARKSSQTCIDISPLSLKVAFDKLRGKLDLSRADVINPYLTAWVKSGGKIAAKLGVK